LGLAVGPIKSLATRIPESVSLGGNKSGHENGRLLCRIGPTNA